MVFSKSSSDRRSLLELSPDHKAEQESITSSIFALDNAAFQTVRDHISTFSGSTNTIFLRTLMESPVLTNLIKVQDNLEETKLEGLVPVGTGNAELISEICQQLEQTFLLEGSELSYILKTFNFKALLDAHDRIAKELITGEKDQSIIRSPWEDFIPQESNKKAKMPYKSTFKEESKKESVIYVDPIKVISLRKPSGQALGVTVEEDDESRLVVARILSGGIIDRSRLMKVGDVILEVNSIPVESPTQLQAEIAKTRDKLQLKVLVRPTENSPVLSGQDEQEFVISRGSTWYNGQKTLCFLRSLFTYDPELDTLLPCKEIGLTFSNGDILQVLDQSDPNWWQARKIGDCTTVGLIPSLELEERRAAFVRPEADFAHSIGICGTRISRKKKRSVYTAKENGDYDKAELYLYEEVTRMPPFRRKMLALVGTSGVGKRTLKTRLLNSDPNKFSFVVPITSRLPLEGEEQMNNYVFITREDFEEGIRNNDFLEYTQKDGNYYGTSYSSIKDIIRHGKMAILDCNPTALKILHNSPEFMPYVVFLAAPGADKIQEEDDFARRHGYSSRTLAFDRMSSIRYSSRRARTLESIASLYEEEDVRQTVEDCQLLQRKYGPYFDLVIINEDFDSTFRQVSQALDALSTDHQWVPVTWVY